MSNFKISMSHLHNYFIIYNIITIVKGAKTKAGYWACWLFTNRLNLGSMNTLTLSQTLCCMEQRRFLLRNAPLGQEMFYRIAFQLCLICLFRISNWTHILIQQILNACSFRSHLKRIWCKRTLALKRYHNQRHSFLSLRLFHKSARGMGYHHKKILCCCMIMSCFCLLTLISLSF